MSVFGVIEGVIGSSESSLQVAEHRIDPSKLRMLHRLRPAADKDALGSASFGICGLKAP